ncbi:MAG TPA: class I SAM-dependent methyltransferase [Candidatus Dormibacteraeota bacterium]|nr:class I SAM-dependent methyltransferase [Candidatus Dormibacteraeota bacterium]
MSFFDGVYAGGKAVYGEGPDAFLAGHLPLDTVRAALDAGGGEGRHALWLARRGVEVELIDASAAAVERVGDRARAEGLPLTACMADLRSWEPERVYDAVLAAIVLHAFKVERAADVAARLRRAVAPGGYLYLSVHVAGGEEERMRRAEGQDERAERTFFGNAHIKTLFTEDEVLAMAAWEPVAVERAAGERCPRADCPYPHDVLRLLTRQP